MAYAEQTFTNIGTVQSPDASQSTAFAGSTPFTFSESTNKLLNEVTQQAVKRRENEVETFNKNLQNALTKVSDIPEGLAEQDYEEITKKKKNIIKEYYNNPEVFLGKNPTKAKELDELLVDLASYTQLSKATKKVDDVYSDLIKKDSDYNNEVNNYYIAKNRAIKDPYERSKNAFTPIKNPMNDFNNVTYPKIVASSETEVETLPDPNDAGTLIINQKKKIDKNVFSEAFKRDNGMYLTEEWNIHPEIHGEYPTPELYIQSKIEKVYKPEFVTTSKTKNLVQYQEAQKNARNEASIEGRATEGEANRAVRLQIASEKASSRNPELKNISPIISNIDGFEDNITNTVEIPKMVQKEIGVQKFSEVSPTYVNEKIIKGIYPNGASQYGDAYGKLFIVTDTKGNQYYTPAKEHFKIKGKEVSKDEYEQAQKIGSKNISKEILPNNDKGKRYTKETLLGSASDNTTNGAYEFDIWKKANGELKAIENEPKQKNVFKYNDISGYVEEFKNGGLGIGSINSGGHNKGSLHGKNLAVDLPASKNGGVEGLKILLTKLKQQYPELDIVDETTKPKGQSVWTGPHIHIEMDSKYADMPKKETSTINKQQDLRNKYGY